MTFPTPTATSTATPTPTASPTPDSGQYGSVLNLQEFVSNPQALPVAALLQPPVASPLPAKVLLTNLPAVAAQGTPESPGSPGTCEAQSFGYGLGSYTAARLPDGTILRDASQPQNEVSAAFQFALAVEKGDATCPAGGLATEYLSRLISFGSPSVSDVPYEPSCAYFEGIDLTAQYPDASNFMLGSFGVFRLSNDKQTLQKLKAYLANGQAVAFSGRVLEGYGKAPVLTDGALYETKIIPGSGHGQLLVGYDDTLGQAGQPGAFLVQNSFGTNWPPASAGFSPAPPGQIYWSYNSFLTVQKFAAVAYPSDPSVPSGTILGANNPAAPTASITRAFQWAEPNSTKVYLVFMHHFAAPVEITTIDLGEPLPGTETAIAGYNQFISSGYTYLVRSDGKEFLPGNYTLGFQVQLLNGTVAVYNGIIPVGNAQPAPLPSAGMAAAGTILDTLLQPVLLSH